MMQRTEVTLSKFKVGLDPGKSDACGLSEVSSDKITSTQNSYFKIIEQIARKCHELLNSSKLLKLDLQQGYSTRLL